MKNPHIRTLPSHRPIICGEMVPIRLYVKRQVKAWKLWLRGEAKRPRAMGPEIGRVESFRFLVSQ